MRVLVATKETQGLRDGDFCWAEEGELVGFVGGWFSEYVEDRSDYLRTMCGLETLRGTTTFKVADVPHDRAWFVDQVKESFVKAGWAELLPGHDVTPHAERLLSIANRFPVGTVLEKRSNRIRPRAEHGCQ